MRLWLLGLIVLCACAGGVPPRSGGAPSSADARYEGAWSVFLGQYLRLNPVRATALGNHDHDGEWPDLTVEGDRTRRSLYGRTLAELDVIPAAELSAEHRLDAEVMKKKLAYFLWYEEALKPAERDPIMYVGIVADGFDPLLTREFAPTAVRAKNLAMRLASVGDVVRAARARLGRPARIFTETAIRQSKGLVSLVDGGFPELLAQAPEERVSVLAAAAKASPALHELRSFLEDELLPRSDGDFRVGKENLEKLGHFLLDDDVRIDELVERARALLAETQDEMAATARELWPDVMKPAPLPAMDTPEARKVVVRQVLARLAEDRPTNATIVRDAADVLARATDFVRSNDLVGLPDQPVKVMEMPEYQRGVAIAYCDSSGPLEARGETHVTLSPTPADWPAERAASFYREYNASMLANLMVHEAMPGHYLQLWHAARFKAVPRAIFDNGAFVEGWAVYGEWLMARHGFGGPKVRLQRQKMLARVCANAILDYGIHAGTMDEKAALDLMENEAFQEEGEAVGKWTRARVTHGQLSTYFYGFTELLKMREAAEKAPGFKERAYHDKLLSFGSPSVHMVRAEMGL